MRLIAAPLAVVATGWVVGACGSTSAAPTAADTTFVQDMASSASAVMSMADQARTRSRDDDIQAMADEIFRTVASAVDRLAELGPQLATAGADGFAHEDGEEHDEATATRVEELLTTPGARFDATFIDLVGQELQAGRAMAATAQDTVADPRTREVADEVVSTWSELVTRVEAG